MKHNKRLSGVRRSTYTYNTRTKQSDLARDADSASDMYFKRTICTVYTYVCNIAM